LVTKGVAAVAAVEAVLVTTPVASFTAAVFRPVVSSALVAS
jgi:hypothetical protein